MIFFKNYCKPSLNDIEFGNQWKCALKFLRSSIKKNNNIFFNNRNGNGKRPKEQQQQHQSRIILELERRRTNYFEYVVNSIKKTVKWEDALIRQVLYTGLMYIYRR